MERCVRGLSIAFVLATLLGSPVPLAAQSGAAQRVQEELEKTDEGLERAAEVVRESESQRARDVLEQAREVQRNAWAQFRSARYPLAYRLTQEARKFGIRAITIAKEQRGLRARAERELEKAIRALGRARDVLGDIADDNAYRLLDEAHLQIQRGQQQFGAQNFEVSLRLAISAQRLIHQAVGSTPGHASDRRIQRELERTDHLLERAREPVAESDMPEARRALQRATQLQTEAWSAYRSGQPRRALATTREARDLVNRALTVARGPVDADRVGKALDETDRLLDRAADIVKESGNETALRVWEKARERQLRARRLYVQADLRQALAETRVARRLGLRAVQLAQPTGAF